jgi:hypothetical protein
LAFFFVLELEISYYSVLISWRILVSFKKDFFEDYIRVWWNYLSFHHSSFALRYFLMLNGKAIVCDTPVCFFFFFVGENLTQNRVILVPTLAHCRFDTILWSL